MHVDAEIELFVQNNTPISSKNWDSFVKNSDNGTMFHEQVFLSYHEEGRFKDNSLYFTRNNNLFAVFPAIEIIKNVLVALFITQKQLKKVSLIMKHTIKPYLAL